MARHRTRYWLAFDLGLRGDYTALYEWLDRHDAKECGESVATILSDQARDRIANELSILLANQPNARVYIIDSKPAGRFIVGKRRKSPPWIGYAEVAKNEDDEG